MTDTVLQALLAFARDYLAATRPAPGAPYSAEAVVDRAEVCRAHRDSLPRTIEFARLRAYIGRIWRLEEFAFYEWDVTVEVGRRATEGKGPP